MKRILFTLLLMLLSIGAWAQYTGTDAIKRAGTHIKVNGERLSQEAQAALLADIGGQDYNAAWEKASKGRNTGMGLAIGGGVATLCGGAVTFLGLTTSVFGAIVGGAVGSIGGQESAQQAANEGASAGKPYTTAGLITSGLGIAAAAVGIPMISKNNKTLNGIVNKYNNRTTAQVCVGSTENGIGLALVF